MVIEKIISNLTFLQIWILYIDAKITKKVAFRTDSYSLFSQQKLFIINLL